MTIDRRFIAGKRDYIIFQVPQGRPIIALPRLKTDIAGKRDHKPVQVPQGQPRIARQFIAGKRDYIIFQVPVGTTDNSPAIYCRVAGSDPIFKSRRDDRK
ncbi:MAG: hypothetical protein BWK80_48775 [Desulfobacteraceae bacterium IS3]|nr:MAG: hypothetical protein BWK80_48775 [Desulfobacteraceae bacterium IS3]